MISLVGLVSLPILVALIALIAFLLHNRTRHKAFAKRVRASVARGIEGEAPVCFHLPFLLNRREKKKKYLQVFTYNKYFPALTYNNYLQVFTSNKYLQVFSYKKT